MLPRHRVALGNYPGIYFSKKVIVGVYPRTAVFFPAPDGGEGRDPLDARRVPPPPGGGEVETEKTHFWSTPEGRDPRGCVRLVETVWSARRIVRKYRVVVGKLHFRLKNNENHGISGGIRAKSGEIRAP